MTMLTSRPAKRIPANNATSGGMGLNRREELELTAFDKPVLDIERMGRRNREAAAAARDFSINRGTTAAGFGDIDEEMEMQFMNSGSNFGGK